MRQTELLHLLTVKLTGDVSSSAAGSRGGKKKKREREKDLAGCPMQGIDGEQHVDTVTPFIHRTYCVQKKALQRRHGDWGDMVESGRWVFEGTLKCDDSY